MYEKVAIITQIWDRTKCYFTSMSNPLYLITVPNMNKNRHILLWASTTNTQTLWKNTQIWHRVKFYFMWMSNTWYLIIVPDMKKIHPAIMKECTRTGGLRGRLMDRLAKGLTYWPLSYIPHSALLKWGIIASTRDNSCQITTRTLWVH